MNIKLRTLLASALLLATSPLFATVADDIQVVDPMIRVVPPVVTTTGAFMTFYNPTDTEHFLVGASTGVAKKVELHMHIHDNGVMRMRQIPHIHLPPHKDKRLKPGGLHLMIYGLKKPLHAGDKVDIELEFDDGSRKTVTATAVKR